MARPQIKLYVDTVSPFAYEAYWILRRDPVFKDCDVTFVPIFLGGLMKKCGNTAPMFIKNKDKWINTERLRWARAFDIPICPQMPEKFPPLTLPIMRALAALTGLPQFSPTPEAAQANLTKALDVLFPKYWVDEVPTFQPEVLQKTLSEIFGEKMALEIMQASGGAEAKKVLADNTDKAFDEGAFGLPWMTCTDPRSGRTEGFWGVDHMGQAAQFLGLAGKVGGVAYGSGNAGWKSVL